MEHPSPAGTGEKAQQLPEQAGIAQSLSDAGQFVPSTHGSQAAPLDELPALLEVVVPTAELLRLLEEPLPPVPS